MSRSPRRPSHHVAAVPQPSRGQRPAEWGLPAGLAQVQPEWLLAMKQRLIGPAPLPVPVCNGQAQLPTSGQAPELYLLRLWQPGGHQLPVRRILLKQGFSTKYFLPDGPALLANTDLINFNSWIYWRNFRYLHPECLLKTKRSPQ
jgi:hypothetical protein